MFGIALIYGACGSFNLKVIGETLAKGSVSPLFIQVGILMILIGFLFQDFCSTLSFLGALCVRRCADLSNDIYGNSG